MSQKNKEVLGDLKEYSSWNKGKANDDKITLFDFATFIATPDMLFAISELFNPELFWFDGCCFIKEKFSKEAYGSWKSKGLEKTEIEKVMNHIHITSILQGEELELNMAESCSELIVYMWNKAFISKDVVGAVIGTELNDLAVTITSK